MVTETLHQYGIVSLRVFGELAYSNGDICTAGFILIWLTFLPVALYDICGWASPGVEAVSAASAVSSFPVHLLSPLSALLLPVNLVH